MSGLCALAGLVLVFIYVVQIKEQLKDEIRKLQGDRDEIFGWTGFTRPQEGEYGFAVIKLDKEWVVRYGEVLKVEARLVWMSELNSAHDVCSVNPDYTFVNKHPAEQLAYILNLKGSKRK